MADPYHFRNPKDSSLYTRPQHQGMASGNTDQNEAEGNEQTDSRSMATVRRKPLSIAPITTIPNEVEGCQDSTVRQHPLTGSISRSSLDMGSMFDGSSHTSTGDSSVDDYFNQDFAKLLARRANNRIEPKGYQNQQQSSTSEYYTKTILRNDGTKELLDSVPRTAHTLQHLRCGESFDSQDVPRNRGREQEIQHTTPVAPVHFRMPERMLSPTNVPLQDLTVVSRLDNLAEVQHVKNLESLYPRMEQTSKRSATKMPSFEQTPAADATTPFLHPSSIAGSSYHSTPINSRSGFLSRGYSARTTNNYTPWNRGNANILQPRLCHIIETSIHAGQISSRFENATAPLHQPSYAPQSAQPTQHANPWDGMTMCEPTLNPSNMLLRKQGALPPTPTGRIRGSPTSCHGGQFQDGPAEEEEKVPDNENCSLWITNMAPTVTAREIFQIIRCGAVYALHIYPPLGEHRTAAAKVVFKRPSSAAFFLQHASSPEGIHPHNRRLRVMYNRNGVREYQGNKTRALRIMGPSHEMIFDVWNAYFQNLCVFEYDEVVFPECHIEGQSIIEFRFMRVDAQSQMIQKEIVDNPKLQRFNAYFSPDPCGP